MEIMTTIISSLIHPGLPYRQLQSLDYERKNWVTRMIIQLPSLWTVTYHHSQILNHLIYSHPLLQTPTSKIYPREHPHFSPMLEPFGLVQFPTCCLTSHPFDSLENVSPLKKSQKSNVLNLLSFPLSNAIRPFFHPLLSKRAQLDRGWLDQHCQLHQCKKWHAYWNNFINEMGMHYPPWLVQHYWMTQVSWK